MSVHRLTPRRHEKETGPHLTRVGRDPSQIDVGQACGGSNTAEEGVEIHEEVISHQLSVISCSLLAVGR
jgi:hypothetical protein